jgi:hypothetical protein
LIDSHLREPHTIGTNVSTHSLSGSLSVGTVLFPPFSGHVKVDVAVKYIPVIKMLFLLQFWNKLGKYKNFGVQIIQKFLILTEKLNI